MPGKKLLSLGRSDNPDDSQGLLRAERGQHPGSTQRTERPPLDTETSGDALHLLTGGAAVASDVSRVNTRWPDLPVIHNAFFVPGKVPSLNDLLDAKSRAQPVLRSIIMRQKPGKGKGNGNRYSAYNDIKQDWTTRTVRALSAGFTPVPACYFGYVIVENDLRRDPSNVCSAAIKFIEDGLVKAKVIPNDGWRHILGIRMVPIHRVDHPPGVYVVMSDKKIDEDLLVLRYEESL